jgi:hypothetical protein
LERLKKFNANRKFKAAAKAVMAVNKMQNLMGGRRMKQIDISDMDDDVELEQDQRRPAELT